MDCNRICRVCLTPEDTQQFTSIFDNNARMASKIHKISGISLLDVDSTVPSLICKKCESDIEAVDKLKLRILDADEYFFSLTADAEKRFFKVDMKKIIDKKLNTTPKPRVKKAAAKTPTPKEASTKKYKKLAKKTTPGSSRPTTSKAKTKGENSKSMKRSLELDYDDISSSEAFKKPKNSPRPSFSPSATPVTLGIQRMLAKGKSFFKNIPKQDRKRSNVGGKLAALARAANKIECKYECDTCLESFSRHQDLDEHMMTHEERFSCSYCDATFDSVDNRYSHVRLRHGIK